MTDAGSKLLECVLNYMQIEDKENSNVKDINSPPTGGIKTKISWRTSIHLCA